MKNRTDAVLLALLLVMRAGVCLYLVFTGHLAWGGGLLGFFYLQDIKSDLNILTIKVDSLKDKINR